MLIVDTATVAVAAHIFAIVAAAVVMLILLLLLLLLAVLQKGSNKTKLTSPGPNGRWLPNPIIWPK